MNDHSWYTLDTALDWLRAFLWCGSNLATAISYFAIPIEIWKWRHELTFVSASIISALFMAFIVLCGESHFVMLFIMQTGPWWATMLVYVPMAFVSVLTAALLRRERRQIVQTLASLNRLLRATRDAK